MQNNEIYQRLYRIEQELDLFNVKIDNIYIWKLIRFEIFQIIIHNTIIINKSINDNILKYIYYISRTIYNSLYSGKGSSRIDCLIIENPRKIMLDNNMFIDPYTYYYINNYLLDTNYEIIDEGFNGIHYDKPGNKRIYSESIYYDIIYKTYLKLFKINLSVEDTSLLNEINNKIYNSFNINININSITINAIYRFNVQYHKYKKILKRKKPKKLFLVCSYGKEGIINAANEQGIDVIELQHGIINEYNSGYSFQGTSRPIPYFPDKILMFGWHWYDNSSIPLPKSSISIIGFDYLNEMKKKYYDLNKINNSVLIVSQPTFADKLLVKAIELAQNNKDYRFIFRLHSKEIHTFDKVYGHLLNYARVNKNLEFDYCQEPIHKQLSKTDYLIGVQSMTIYEALAFETKVIIIDINDSNILSHLTDNKYAHIFDYDENINFRKIGNLKKPNLSYYFYN